MALQGLRDTSNFIAEGRPKNWREGILLLFPNGKAPLTALTSVMKKRVTDDPEFNWWEKSFPTQRVALADAAGNELDAVAPGTSQTHNVVSGAKQLRKDHVLYVEETGELMLVEVDPPSDTAVQVTRGFAGTTPAIVDAATDNPNLLVVGNAMVEGSTAPTAIAYDPVKKFNFTQIWRNTLEMTRTAMKTRLRTGDQVREARREALELHSVEQERAFIWGQRSEDISGSTPRRTTGGILSYIDSTRVIDHSAGPVSMTDLENDLELLFREGSQQKMAFCGNLALLTIQRIVRLNATYELVQGQKEFGMNVSRLVSPFGEVVLRTHPLFNILTGGTGYLGFNSHMLILDMEHLLYRPLKESDTKYEPDIATNDFDGLKAGYITEAGLEIHHPTVHMWIKGLASATTG